MEAAEPLWSMLVHACLSVAVILGVALPGVALLQRRLTARLHRSTAVGGAGPRGFFQPWADALKLLSKTPAQDVPLTWARLFALWLAWAPPLVILILIPCRGCGMASAVANSGVVTVLALMSASAMVPGGLSTWGGGWSSTVGGMRSAAQMITATLCVAVCLIGVAWMARSPRLVEIMASQAGVAGGASRWNALLQPGGFVACAGALMMWSQLPPFAAGRSASALNGGYQSACAPAELAWMRASGYLRRLCAGALLTALYLGGDQLPWGAFPGPAPLLDDYLGLGIFAFKTLVVLMLFVWLGAVLPSLRWDRLQQLLWRRLLPLALANLAWVGLLSTFLAHDG